MANDTIAVLTPALHIIRKQSSRKAKTIEGPSDLALTPGEIKLIRAFRRVAESTQAAALSFVEHCAASDLARSQRMKKPVLRIVAGGRK